MKAVTRPFNETVAGRVASDPDFRCALLVDAANEFLSGDLDVAKILLRDYINASPQFEAAVHEKKKHKN